MRNRSSIYIFGAALGGCLVLLICAAALGLAAFFVLSQGIPLSAFASPSVNQIAYIGNDGHVYTVDPQGGHRAQLTKDADNGTTLVYDYPSWSPDSRRLAFVGTSYSGGNPKQAAIYAAQPNGTNLTTLYKTQDSFPFYLYWSPDSHHLTFLSNKGSDTLALQAVASDKQNAAQELATGSPIFFAWSPDSRDMFVHLNGTLGDSQDARVAVVPFGSNDAQLPVTGTPGTFQTPQWSPDGQSLLFSKVDGSKQVVAISNAAGDNVKTLFDFQGRIAFSLSPAGDKIAYIVTDPSLSIPNFGQVQVIGTDGKNNAAISDDHALAFFWSPNGKSLAYASVMLQQTSPSGSRSIFASQHMQAQISLQWKVYDTQTGKTTTIATFSPTDSMLGVIAFFDQYSRSNTIWSPDSSLFVYTNADSPSAGSIWVADATGKIKPRKISDGMIAFWSWK